MGVILGSGVVPIALCITWSKANKWGCIVGSVVGFAAGLIAWLITTSTLYGGVINVTVRGVSIATASSGCACAESVSPRVSRLQEVNIVYLHLVRPCGVSSQLETCPSSVPVYMY